MKHLKNIIGHTSFLLSIIAIIWTIVNIYILDLFTNHRNDKLKV